MSITTEFLKEMGVTDDNIPKIMKEYGESINPIKKENDALKKDKQDLESKVANADKTVKDLKEQVKGVDGKETTITDLQSKLDAYEQAEKDKETAKKLAEENKVIEDNITKAIGDKEFVNEFTKTSIISKVAEEIKKAENKGIGATEIFEEITKDVDGIFKNPQGNVKIEKNNGTGSDTQEADSIKKARAVMGLSEEK